MSRLCIERQRVQASVGILDDELRSRQQLLISLTVEMLHALNVFADCDGGAVEFEAQRDLSAGSAA